jgi:hypothetical protein
MILYSNLFPATRGFLLGLKEKNRSHSRSRLMKRSRLLSFATE